MYLNLHLENIKDVISHSRRHISMDAPLGYDDDGNMYDVYLSKDSPSPEKELLTDSLRKEIARALKNSY